MDKLRYDHTISVLIERSAENGLSIAHFGWQEDVPHDSYTIPISQNVSLELDKHFPLRPNSISMYDRVSSGEVGGLDMYLPEEITRGLLQARRVGTQILVAELSDTNRQGLLRLQAESPSTPPPLRIATFAMMGHFGIGLSELIPNIASEPESAALLQAEEPPAA